VHICLPKDILEQKAEVAVAQNEDLIHFPSHSISPDYNIVKKQAMLFSNPKDLVCRNNG
jgi:hypothetical protein